MSGFTPPPYPYDLLEGLKAAAAAFPGGLVDLSIGTPSDPPPTAVVDAMASSGSERSYPPSIGTVAFRQAAAGWLDRRLGVTVDPAGLAACIGSKELVAGLPQWLRLRDPGRDTVLYPAVSYPTYAVGATLAGCRAVPVPCDDRWRLDLAAIDSADATHALCLWVNTPGNPAGGLDDLGEVARWGRANGVTVLSDECYVEFTWEGPPRTILEHGLDGVLAVHSLSKRSNLAGARAGFYAGDPELVGYLSEVRKHAGFMVPGPVQAAAVAAWADDAHVDVQRERYADRLDRLAAILNGCGWGLEAHRPGGGFYLWVPAPAGDAWALTRRLAEEAGVLVSPGEFYGAAGAGHVRMALVQPLERLDLVGERLVGTAGPRAVGDDADSSGHAGIGKNDQVTYPVPQGPSKSGFVLGGILLVVGVLGGTLLVVLGVVSTVDRINGYQRVATGSGGTVEFASAGRYNAYFEQPGVDSRADIPGDLQVELIGPTGVQTVLTPRRSGDADDETYDLNDHAGARFARFRVDAPGRYEVRLLGEPTTAEIAFGKTAIAGLAIGAVAGIFGGGFLALVGFILLIATGVRRGNHRKRFAYAGAGHGGPGYGGPGYGAPGYPVGSGYGGPAPGVVAGWAPAPPSPAPPSPSPWSVPPTGGADGGPPFSGPWPTAPAADENGSPGPPAPLGSSWSDETDEPSRPGSADPTS